MSVINYSYRLLDNIYAKKPPSKMVETLSATPIVVVLGVRVNEIGYYMCQWLKDAQFNFNQKAE